LQEDSGDPVDVEQGDVALDHLDHALLPHIVRSVRLGGRSAMFSFT